MTPFGFEIPAAARGAIRASLVQNGLPHEAVDEVTDLAIAAAADALAAAVPKLGMRTVQTSIRLDAASQGAGR